MSIEANVADFDRAWRTGRSAGLADEIDSPDSVLVDSISSCAFARPRTSSANTAAGFFLDLSSSDDLEDDIIVSRVP